MKFETTKFQDSIRCLISKMESREKKTKNLEERVREWVKDFEFEKHLRKQKKKEITLNLEFLKDRIYRLR